MPTQKPRIIITLSDDQKHFIDLYQEKEGINSQSKAVLDLVYKGLGVVFGAFPPREAYNREETELVHYYRDASPAARKKATATLMASARIRGRSKRVLTDSDNILTIIELYAAASPEVQKKVFDNLSEHFNMEYDDDIDADSLDTLTDKTDPPSEESAQAP